MFLFFFTKVHICLIFGHPALTFLIKACACIIHSPTQLSQRLAAELQQFVLSHPELRSCGLSQPASECVHAGLASSAGPTQMPKDTLQFSTTMTTASGNSFQLRALQLDWALVLCNKTTRTQGRRRDPRHRAAMRKPRLQIPKWIQTDSHAWGNTSQSIAQISMPVGPLAPGAHCG
jgi:hypothetical protein